MICSTTLFSTPSYLKGIFPPAKPDDDIRDPPNPEEDAFDAFDCVGACATVDPPVGQSDGKLDTLHDRTWGRIVFDEGHEADPDLPSVRGEKGTRRKVSFYAMERLKARHRWVVSATPVASISELLLNVDSGGNAQSFLDHFAAVAAPVPEPTARDARAAANCSTCWVSLSDSEMDAYQKERTAYIQPLKERKRLICAATQPADAGASVRDVQRQNDAREKRAEAALAGCAEPNEVLKNLLARAKSQKTYFDSVVSSKDSRECPLCLDKIEPIDTRITSCGHVFHAECIADLQKNGSRQCPTCRERLLSSALHSAAR